MIIKNMEKSDVPFVAEIEKECFSMPWSEQAFYDELENPYGVTLVAVVEGTVAGFLNVRDVLGEIYINNIAVKRNYRRRGIAQKLLLELEKRAYDFITLEVRESNESAIKLYEKMDYKRVGVRRNFYEKPTENAILMTKTKEEE